MVWEMVWSFEVDNQSCCIVSIGINGQMQVADLRGLNIDLDEVLLLYAVHDFAGQNSNCNSTEQACT